MSVKRKQLFNQLVSSLEKVSSEPKEEAVLILCQVLNVERKELLEGQKVTVGDDNVAIVKRLLDKRLKGKPLQYVLNEAWFYDSCFYVDERVLIPRSETEWMVEKAIEEITNYKLQITKLRVADIGTGCGAVAISLAKEMFKRHSEFISESNSNMDPELSSGRRVTVYATDVSKEALEVARMNAKRVLELSTTPGPSFKRRGVVPPLLKGRLGGVGLKFLHGSLLDPLPEPVNVILANLPYIPKGRISHLQAEVKDFEPHVALDGGEDGFDWYRKLFRQMKGKTIAKAFSHSQGGGWLSPGIFLGEIDYTHRSFAAEELKKYFPETEAKVIVDPVNKQPFLVGRI